MKATYDQIIVAQAALLTETLAERDQALAELAKTRAQIADLDSRLAELHAQVEGLTLPAADPGSGYPDPVNPGPET